MKTTGPLVHAALAALTPAAAAQQSIALKSVTVFSSARIWRPGRLVVMKDGNICKQTPP